MSWRIVARGLSDSPCMCVSRRVMQFAETCGTSAGPITPKCTKVFAPQNSRRRVADCPTALACLCGPHYRLLLHARAWRIARIVGHGYAEMQTSLQTDEIRSGAHLHGQRDRWAFVALGTGHCCDHPLCDCCPSIVHDYGEIISLFQKKKFEALRNNSSCCSGVSL